MLTCLRVVPITKPAFPRASPSREHQTSRPHVARLRTHKEVRREHHDGDSRYVVNCARGAFNSRTNQDNIWLTDARQQTGHRLLSDRNAPARIHRVAGVKHFYLRDSFKGLSLLLTSRIEIGRFEKFF